MTGSLSITFYCSAVVILWGGVPPSLVGAGGSEDGGRAEALTALEGDSGPLCGAGVLSKVALLWSERRATVHCKCEYIRRRQWALIPIGIG